MQPEPRQAAIGNSQTPMYHILLIVFLWINVDVLHTIRTFVRFLTLSPSPGMGWDVSPVKVYGQTKAVFAYPRQKHSSGMNPTASSRLFPNFQHCRRGNGGKSKRWYAPPSPTDSMGKHCKRDRQRCFQVCWSACLNPERG